MDINNIAAKYIAPFILKSNFKLINDFSFLLIISFVLANSEIISIDIAI